MFVLVYPIVVSSMAMYYIDLSAWEPSLHYILPSYHPSMVLLACSQSVSLPSVRLHN